MKYRIIIALIILYAVLCPWTCCSEQSAGNNIFPDSSWTWNPGAINQFSGEYDLSDLSDTTLNIQMISNMPDEDEADKTLVFIYINGKRIPILKQDNTVQFTPDADQPIFRFTGQVKLPKKHRVHDIRFTIIFYDGNGKEVKRADSAFSSHDTSGYRSDGSFYIPFDISGITVILSAVAALIWICALGRSRIYRNKNRNGENNHADL